jgi:hypothetical protein
MGQQNNYAHFAARFFNSLDLKQRPVDIEAGNMPTIKESPAALQA